MNHDHSNSVVAMASIADELTRATGVNVRAGMRGAQCTTLSIGGLLPYFVEPASLADACSVIRYLGAAGVPPRLLGAGSNLLLPSAGLDQWVLRLGRGFRTIKELGEGRFQVGASTSLMTLSRELSENGFSGLEFAGGIPASIGGAVRMNAGAHGGEISSVVESIQIVDRCGNEHQVNGGELQFSYRHCSLPKDVLIVGAVIKLVPADRVRTAERRAHCLAERKARQPLALPSAGSIFRNPSPECTAGALLEQAGVKGRIVGGAQISTLHANWIVNPERSATDGDVRSLIEICQRAVLERAGRQLVPEIVIW